MFFNKATIFTAVVTLSTLAVGQMQSSQGQTKVHIVKVSDKTGSLKFNPDQVTALAGEMVQFQFYPMNHSVVQSSFQDPCIPIANSPSGNGTKGFFSGFMPVSADSEMMPTFTIPITNTKPIWFYCATGKHCQLGMVGVINVPQNNPDRTLDIYRQAAAKTKSIAPPSEFGGQEGNNSPNSTSTNSTGPSMTSSASSPAQPASTGSASTVSVSLGVVFGAIGIAFFLA